MNKVIVDFYTDKFGYIFTCDDGSKIKFSIDYGCNCCDMYGLFLVRHESEDKCKEMGLSAVEMGLDIGKEWFIDSGPYRKDNYFSEFSRVNDGNMLKFGDGFDIKSDIVGKKLVSCGWGLDFYSKYFRSWVLPRDMDVWKCEEGSGMIMLKKLCDQRCWVSYPDMYTACLSMKFVDDLGKEFCYTLVAYNEHNGYYKHSVEYIFGDVMDRQEI